MPLGASPLAVGWLAMTVAAVAVAGAALGVVVQDFVQQRSDAATYREWEAYKAAPSTLQAVDVANGILQQVQEAVGRAATTAGADAVLVGSYRNLSFQAPLSDVDIKVMLNACQDFDAVHAALTKPPLGFTHMYTAPTYALFRRVADGPRGELGTGVASAPAVAHQLHVDVSVTARDRPSDLRDDMQCVDSLGRDLDLRGFFMRMARQSVRREIPDAPYVTVRHSRGSE